jgi:adenylosuccinate synthase
MPGWKDDLSKIDLFTDLPNEAKHYIARMVNSIIESAYPHGAKGIKLPKIRFIGVGPDPSQIISDIPNTLDLINNF